MYTLSSLTPRSIQTFLQKAGEGVGSIKDGNPGFIDSGRRNTIKAGLAGLLVVATATNAVNTLAGEVDKGAGQAVETPFGKLSFAQIQKHPERTKILDGMKDAEYNTYDEWQSGKVQVAIETNKGKLETQQVVIEDGNRVVERRKDLANERTRLELEALAKMRTVVAGGGNLKKEYEPLVLKYATTPPPDKNALYIQEEAKKRQVFA